MQKKILTEKLQEQATVLKKLLPQLEELPVFEEKEIDSLLNETESLVRLLAAYKFLVSNTEKKDIDVHIKIMQTLNKQEETKAVTETVIATDEAKTEIKIPAEPNEPVKPEQQLIEKKEEKEPESTVISRKKIELGINDKYRIINELFEQSNQEFSAALEQLNMIETYEDATTYLESLKNLYSWKTEHPLVKLLYSLVQKRFQ